MNRFKQIDILRAAAVFLVLGRHMAPCPADSNVFLGSVTRIWAQGGWIGVDLFFVLSGFLVSGLLFREHEKFRTLRLGHFFDQAGLQKLPALLGADWVYRRCPVVASSTRAFARSGG